MRVLGGAALVAAAVLATPAMAQDGAANFTGFHVAVLGGGDQVEVDDGLDNPSTGNRENGVLYGVGAGYDFSNGRLVFGIEAEATESTTSQCDANVCVEAGRDLYAGGRIGFTVGDNAIVYLKAGYTNARSTLEVDGNSVDGVNLDGIRGGIGTEIATDSNFFVRLEYRYSDYEADITRHQLVAGIGLRF